MRETHFFYVAPHLKNSIYHSLPDVDKTYSCTLVSIHTRLDTHYFGLLYHIPGVSNEVVYSAQCGCNYVDRPPSWDAIYSNDMFWLRCVTPTVVRLCTSTLTIRHRPSTLLHTTVVVPLVCEYGYSRYTVLCRLCIQWQREYCHTRNSGIRTLHSTVVRRDLITMPSPWWYRCGNVAICYNMSAFWCMPSCTCIHTMFCCSI